METSTAKRIVACDECGASLGELYPTDKNNISMDLVPLGQNNQGDSYTEYNGKKQHTFCNEGCALAHLTKRSKSMAKTKKVARANVVVNGEILIEIPTKKKE